MSGSAIRPALVVALAVATLGAFAAPAAAAAPTVFSARTGASTFLSDTGGVRTTVESLALPKGSWTITSAVTAIDFRTADFVRCSLQNDGTTFDGGATTFLQDTVGDVANAGVVKLKAAATISIGCSHDQNATTSGQFYIDPGATLMAVSGGPISVQKTTASVTHTTTGPTVVQKRSIAQAPIPDGDTGVVATSIRIGAGIWDVSANLSVVQFDGDTFASCYLTDPHDSLPAQVVEVGDSDSIVSNVALQDERVYSAATTLKLECFANESGAYVDPGATLTATLVPAADDIVASAYAGGHQLSDTGGTQTKVFHETIPAGAWRVTSDASAYVLNPNGGIGNATDFVRCTLLAGKTSIDGGATVLINDTDTSGDYGNFEQDLLNIGTFTAKKPWTLTLSCSHDNTIGTGQHWVVVWYNPIIAVKQGPISSTVS